MAASVSKSNAAVSITAYRGDAKVLLAFNLPSKRAAKGFAGFTVEVKPKGKPSYFLYNTLQFEDPSRHAQDAKESVNSSLNAPLHKFRWVHVPGSIHQGIEPYYGEYQYTVTPRYFDADASLLPMDSDTSLTITVDVAPFKRPGVELGFSRGFVQSQAFSQRFGPKALIRPKGKELRFDTSQVSGSDAQGNEYTYEQQYQWLGLTARARIFDVLNEVLADRSLRLDVFAYDLNEPDIVEAFLTLAKQGRIRVILDNASLHHSTSETKPEDEFEELFVKAAKGDAQILRGKFKRYSHDKVLLVSKGTRALKVLTGSTNFSVTGLYVNSNHVLVFTDKKVVDKYAELFEACWDGDAKAPAYLKLPIASETFSASSSKMPDTEITFAPHSEEFATEILEGIVDRIGKESRRGKRTGSLLFAVMAIDNGVSPVYQALTSAHADESIFSYGISDSRAGIALYKPGRKSGVLVTGKPGKAQLPWPFSEVASVAGHQVHHKFVVCGFNTPDAVVYCGSSNLAVGGEISNGDNLLAIHDTEIATVFAIEALAMVDHFHYLNKLESKTPGKSKKTPASKRQAAVEAKWFLSTSDHWVQPYFDPKDLHCVDRLLFA
ncbi:phospholipase D-like domain-containing protein [Lysobacter terrae]